MKRIIFAGISLGVAAPLLVASPAHASNFHQFGSSTYSTCTMLVSTNPSGSLSHLYPGGARYGDWLYVPSGKVATNTARTLGQGWHYDGGLARDTYRCATR